MTTEARERLRDAWVSDAEITRATTHDDVHSDGPSATNRLLYAVRHVNLPAVLNVVEAAKEWRATWCVPLSGPALSAASRDRADRATDALKAALVALTDQPNGADAPDSQGSVRMDDGSSGGPMTTEARELVGEPLFWNGKYRTTDACLRRMVKGPSTFAAWVLRDTLRELQERRAVALADQPNGADAPTERKES